MNDDSINPEVLEHMVLDFKQMRDFARHPFIAERGDGVRLTTMDGKTYIDGLAGVFVVSVGHNNRAVIDAITAQMQTFSFAPPLHGTNRRAVELAELLREVAPPGLGSVKLLSGGSEATESAMKLARQYHIQNGHPRKYKIVSSYGSFHGATWAAMSASGGAERKSPFEPLGVGFIHTYPPYCYRCPFDKSYPSCGITCAKLVARTIENEDPETVSAVIMGPASISSGGFIVPPSEFFAIIRDACDKHDVVLIFDEIITGYGRMGEMFGANYHKVVPDVLCCGKGMSGGYAPLAAIIFADRIQAAFLAEPEEHKEFHHGFTYSGNPVASAAGVAVLHEIRKHDLIAHGRQMGAYLRGKLDAMYDKYAIIGEVRGAGLLQGMEFVRDRATKAPFTKLAPGKVIEKEAMARGLILRCGTEFVAFAPALVVTEADIDAMCAILEESIAAAQPQLLASEG
ncbi:MAG: aminotransferase family protein [Chloroflexota bacterium]